MQTCVVVALMKLKKSYHKFIPHLPYSQDLAHSKSLMIPNLKKWVHEKRFGSIEEMIPHINACFENLDKSYYSECLENWKNIGRTIWRSKEIFPLKNLYFTQKVMDFLTHPSMIFANL